MRTISVLCCALVSLFCFVLTWAHDIPPQPDMKQTVLVRPTENNTRSCTGTVVSPGLLLTATHCLGEGATAVFAELLTSSYRKLTPQVVVGDFAMMSFEPMDNDKWTEIRVNLLSNPPPTGASLWAVGLVDIEDKYMAIASFGISLGQRVKFRGVFYEITSIPVVKGMSGGPVYYKGEIVGVYAIGLTSEVSPWAGFASPK